MIAFSNDKHVRLEFSHFSWSSSRESFAFSAVNMPNLETSTPDFRHNLMMSPTVCQASSVGASTFDKPASCWMMNLGQEDRQLVFLIFKFYHPRETAFSFGILTCGDPWCFAHDDFKPFMQLAWNEIVSFTLDTKSVDGATSHQQDSEMSWVATIARKDGGK
jgi:hypothetical protein